MTVTKRLANGNLLVRGQKWITINQGREYVRMQGIVRPVDIAPDNTVPSTMVADATITYGGKGALNDANSKGWLARFFDSSGCRSEVPIADRMALRGCAGRSCSASWHSLPCCSAPLAQAERVKDLASVAGVRTNQLVGYGLVVGLNGTGDQTTQAPFTVQSIANMLAKFGVTIPPSVTSAAEERRGGHA